MQIGVIEEAPGLFSQIGAQNTTGAAPVGATATNLQPVTVAKDGTVYVPFAGHIVAKGRTVEEVRAAIELALADKAANPQVEVSILTNTNPGANSATVGGEVNHAGMFSLQPSGSRLLDVIDQAGSAHFPAYEITVHLNYAAEDKR